MQQIHKQYLHNIILKKYSKSFDFFKPLVIHLIAKIMDLAWYKEETQHAYAIFPTPAKNASVVRIWSSILFSTIIIWDLQRRLYFTSVICFVDICDSYCLNGGTCKIDDNDTPTCACTIGNYGQFCNECKFLYTKMMH